MGSERPRGDDRHEGQSAEAVATAPWSSGAIAHVVRELATRAVPVMVLKGPPVRQRLLGTESPSRSGDVELLVPRRRGRRARARLRASGWRRRPDKGFLWRLDRTLALERSGVVLDLHWGIHLGLLPPWTLAPLERALWEGASPDAGGWWQPRPEPLLVYLALEAAAFDFSEPAGLSLVHAAANLVDDWAEVEGLSRRLGTWPAVKHAIGRAQGTTQASPSLLTGRKGRLLLSGMQFLRSAAIPDPALRAMRAARDRLPR